MVPSQTQDKVSQLTVKESDKSSKNRPHWDEKPKPMASPSSPPWKKYLKATIALQTVLIFSLAGFSVFAVNTVSGYIAINQKQTHVISEQSSELKQLAKSTATLKAQVENLHHFIASKSAVNEIFLKIMILKPDLDPDVATEIARLVHKYAILYGRDTDLVLSIIATESSFDPHAVSPKGAEGLMQIMPQWKKVLGIKDSLQDPATSINYGLQIFGFYKEMYKETDMALTAYNRGPGPVDMALMRGESPKNNYAPTVFKTYKRLQALNVNNPRK